MSAPTGPRDTKPSPSQRVERPRDTPEGRGDLFALDKFPSSHRSNTPSDQELHQRSLFDVPNKNVGIRHPADESAEICFRSDGRFFDLAFSHCQNLQELGQGTFFWIAETDNGWTVFGKSHW